MKSASSNDLTRDVDDRSFLPRRDYRLPCWDPIMSGALYQTDPPQRHARCASKSAVRSCRVALSPDASKVYEGAVALSMANIVRIPDGLRLFGVF